MPVQPRLQSVRVEDLCNCFHTFAGKVERIHPADGFRFFRHNDVFAVPHPVSQKSPVPGLTFLEVLTDTPFLILACRLALRLCEGCQDGHHDLTVAGERVNVLLLKKDIHPQRFQFTDCLKKSDRVPRKAGDGFCDDHIDISGTAFCHEPLKVFPAVLCAGFGFVSINACVLPAGVVLYPAAVFADLCRQRMEHGVFSGRDPGICSHPFQLRCRIREVYSLNVSTHFFASFVSIWGYYIHPYIMG